MPTQIVMPQLGESVAEGVIGKWLKAEGDSIAKDEPIVEVVTDKVNAEIPSPVAGVLQKISAAEGATVLVGEEMAVIGDAGEVSSSAQRSEQPSIETSAAEPSAAASSDDSSTRTATGNLSAQPAAVSIAAIPEALTPAARVEGPASQNGVRHPVRSSPLVQRLAAESNIDLSQVPGTGIGGRVSKRDILQFLEHSGSQAQPAAPAPTAAPPTIQEAPLPSALTPPTLVPPALPAAPPRPQAAPRPAPVSPTVATPPQQAVSAPATPGANEEYLPISPVRRMIAEHMVKSKFTIPHATSMIEVDMTPVVKYREANKRAWQASQGISLSFMAFVALATVESLRQHPLVNSEWGGDKIIVKRNINLGLAVAAQNGLVVPNIKNADRLSLGGLAHGINDLTVRARNGKLTPDDVGGGTFTLNNTGAIGSVWSVSVINYPQAGILSADAIVKRVRVMDDDSIAIRHMMNLCMSFDHRTLDGATVSDFLQFIRRRLEGWSEERPL